MAKKPTSTPRKRSRVEELEFALTESTDMLDNLHGYCLSMRRKVMDNVELAVKGGFTYVDLDTLDDVHCRIFSNNATLLRKEACRGPAAKV